MVFGFTPHHGNAKGQSFSAYLLSSLEAFLRSYGTLYVELISFPDRQEELENKPCMNVLQMMLYFAFDEEMCRTYRYNKCVGTTDITIRIRLISTIMSIRRGHGQI